MKKLFENKFLKFISSIQLALPMILLVSACLAAGTIVESLYSTAVAKRFVYGTWWFGGILLLLGLNVLASALSRFPWKKHQTGFVITHVGILCILAGSLMTQKLGVDGQIALNEGEEGHIFQEDKPTLYYQIGNGDIEHIPAGFQSSKPSPDHPLLIHLPDDGLLMVDQFYLNAQKQVHGRAAEAGEKAFPAAHITLNSSFVHEDQWLFLGHPQYGRLDLGPASVFFEKEEDWKKRLAGGAKDVSENALAILVTASGELRYQTRHRGEFTAVQALVPGAETATGWMDMQFKLQDRLAAAVPEETFTPQPLPNQKDPEPALHYQVLKRSEKMEGWLGYQNQVNLTIGGNPFGLAYGPQQLSLPFAIQLIHFNLGLDPGTEKAASYASDIRYKDPEDPGTEVPATISMNNPLHYKGYTVYQASYQALPGGKYISVFAVGADPGITLKYGGALIMVLGIIFMFWFKNPTPGKKE